jgi:cobalt-zinc-cadmium resistance protein CzcA
MEPSLLLSSLRFIASKAAQLGPLSKEDRQIQIDQITYNGASKMMNSAIFGQLIILIVSQFFLFQVSKVKCLNLPMAMTLAFGRDHDILFYVSRCFFFVLKPKEETLIRFLVD